MTQPEAPATTAAETPNPYPSLTKNFLRGSTKGQISSLWNTRETKPEKIADFKKALATGDVTIDEVLTKSQTEKMASMGIEVPADKKYVPKPAEPAAAAATPDATAGAAA
jgi:hypothetical protein